MPQAGFDLPFEEWGFPTVGFHHFLMADAVTA